MASGQMRIPELNFIIISGRLTRDPDNRMTQKGQPICSFDVAVNRRYMDNATGEWKEDVAYVPVTLFGPSAERSKDRLKKGCPVVVEGRLTMNEFVDRSGQNRKVLRITARRLQILQSAENMDSAPAEAAASTDDIGEDDVPF